MSETLVIIGAFCVIAAIVGGGLTLANVGEIPVVDSVRRQALLGLFGVAAISGGVATGGSDKPSKPDNGTSETRPDVSTPSLPPGIDDSGDEPALEVSRRSGRPGTRVRVEGYGFRAGETVRLRLHTIEVASEKADTRGRFRITIEIPEMDFVQQYSLVAQGRESITSVEEPFRITACARGWTQMGKACFPPGLGLPNQ